MDNLFLDLLLVIWYAIISNLSCLIIHPYFFLLFLNCYWVAIFNSSNVCGVLKLWMVGFQQVPCSNQDTQTNIKSYHNALKHWFSLDTKGLRGHWIDWLVWMLTTTIAHHYMQTMEMRKKGFIKNKIVEAIVRKSVEKATLILLTHVA